MFHQFCITWSWKFVTFALLTQDEFCKLTKASDKIKQ
jgi:hypothetical protein